MTETVITVRGEHTASYTPEIATLAINVNIDGADRTDVFDDAKRATEDMRNRVIALHDEKVGPIIRWHSGSVQVWGDRPWNSDGNRLPIVYHARIDLRATFSDFDVLAHFIEDVAETSGVSTEYLEWGLTRENLLAVTDEVREFAVHDAVAKAIVYAKAIGLSRVTATAIADQGMLGNQSNSSGGGYSLASSHGVMATGGGAPELSLKPEDIEVSAVVDARFLATAG